MSITSSSCKRNKETYVLERVQDSLVDEEDLDWTLNLFASNDDDDAYEVSEFHFLSLLAKIEIRGRSHYNQSTGMSLWLASQVLCEYLVQHSETIRDKQVLELGAGVGLCGIMCHCLGASHVILTDGDTDVLKNWRYNVKQNISSDTDCVSCPQLIWGTNLSEFERANGKQDVILGCDLVYMTKSLAPLWSTVEKLLESNGLFLYVNLCSSQASEEEVLETARKFGFTWTCSNQVYMFRRKHQGESLSFG